MGKKQQNRETVIVSEKKVNAVLGSIILLIIFGILGVNLYFRFTDRHKGDGYEYVDGVITKKENRYSYIGRSKSSKTWITVEYTPKGSTAKRVFSGTDFSYDYLFRGETVRVYYKGGDPRENVFIAKYDWLVKDYLPAYKSYNIPLIVSCVLLIISIYFFVDDTKPKKKKNSIEAEFSVDPVTGKVYDRTHDRNIHG